MLRKGAFIMRVRKVDSDAIKLYESSQVKFKTTGTIREVQFSAGVNKSCAIQNISKDTYLDKATGEIKERKHNTNRFQSPKSVRKRPILLYYFGTSFYVIFSYCGGMTRIFFCSFRLGCRRRNSRIRNGRHDRRL